MLTQFIQSVQENWDSHLDLLLNITVVVAAAWLCLTIFIHWRRSVTNLTPVDVPRANRNAQPDFLKVDHAKREEALKRGDRYARKIGNDDRVTSKAVWLKSALRLVAVTLSIVCIAAILFGILLPGTGLGRMVQEYSQNHKINEIASAKPIALTVAIIAILVRATGLLFKRDA